MRIAVSLGPLLNYCRQGIMAEDSSAELAAVCRRQFEKCYGYRVEKAFFAPGRINIIGEHIDYNGGLVFPCAIGLGTAAAVGRL